MWSMLLSPSVLFRYLGAGFEAIAVIASLQDVAVVRQSVEQGSGHLGVHCPAGASGRCCRVSVLVKLDIRPISVDRAVMRWP